VPQTQPLASLPQTREPQASAGQAWQAPCTHLAPEAQSAPQAFVPHTGSSPHTAPLQSGTQGVTQVVVSSQVWPAAQQTAPHLTTSVGQVSEASG
jgi:hypothetical protein